MVILRCIPAPAGDKIFYDRLEKGTKETIKQGILSNMIAED
jgi:hypothetical protein